LLQVLKQCDDDFSRANIMKQAANLHDANDPVVLPGKKVNTSPTNFHPIKDAAAEVDRQDVRAIWRRDRGDELGIN
jgi:hypothetical protein